MTASSGASPDGLIVNARGLVKRFGSFVALDGLDLVVAPGEVTGFLGPNGAGKTVTIRCLLGQSRLDGGTATIFGRDVWTDAVAIHERLAYVPGDVSLWPGLTGGECIDVLLRFQGSHDRGRRDELIERFQLDPTKRARTYSKGNRQKVALIAALAADVELLVLDEPTSGLDPLMEAQFQEVVRARSAQGCSVLLSSHILSEVEALCDRVTIVRAGRSVVQATLAELRTRAQSTIQVTTPAPVGALLAGEGVTIRDEHRLGDGQVRTVARVTERALSDAVHRVLEAGGHGLVVEPASLDELFLEQYRDDDAGTPR